MRLGVFAGRVGRAELRNSKSGKAVLGFSLAVDTRNGSEKGTLWVDCSLWGDRASALAPYVVKGAQIAVSGDVGIRQYESNGQHRAELTLTAYNVTLMGSRRDEERPAHPEPQPAPDFDDGIPF